MDHRDEKDVPTDNHSRANGSVRIPRSSFQLAGEGRAAQAETSTSEDVRTPVSPPVSGDVAKHLSLHGSAAGKRLHTTVTVLYPGLVRQRFIALVAALFSGPLTGYFASLAR